MSDRQWTPQDAASTPLAPACARVKIVDAADGRVVCDPPRRKLAIAAFGPSLAAIHQLQADPSWEIWGLNNGYQNRHMYTNDGFLRVDRWWEMHPMRVQPKDDETWMRVCPVPIYVLDLKDANPGGQMPNAVQFPLKRCEALVNLPGPWFASTFAYQIALAILEGFTTIAILGCDFGSAREWLFERANLLWWVGFAAGRGVQILLPHDSTLMQHPQYYGYDYDPEVAWCEQMIGRLMDSWVLGDPVVKTWLGTSRAVEYAGILAHGGMPVVVK